MGQEEEADEPRPVTDILYSVTYSNSLAMPLFEVRLPEQTLDKGINSRQDGGRGEGDDKPGPVADILGKYG